MTLIFLIFCRTIIQTKTMNDIFKVKRREKLTIYIIGTILAVLLVTFIIASFAYNSNNKTQNGQIVLGDIDFKIIDSGGTYENIVPGDVIPNVVKLVNARNLSGTDTKNLCSLLVRFSLPQQDEIVSLNQNNSLWTSDGIFYYYNGIVGRGQNINLCDSINFLKSVNNSYQGQGISVNFYVEAIQAENDAYLELWGDAPVEWKNIISNQNI